MDYHKILEHIGTRSIQQVYKFKYQFLKSLKKNPDHPHSDLLPILEIETRLGKRIKQRCTEGFANFEEVQEL